MAANQKSQDIDTLSIRKLFVKGDNNTTIAKDSILVTDGKGGTLWVDMSTFQRGVTFNTFVTTQSTFRSAPYSSQFSILDGPNAGLYPGNSTNTALVYAKAFGQIDISGQDSIYSFDTYSGQINSNVSIVGSGVINITSDTTKNKMEFYSPDNGTSSMSTVVGNFIGLNGNLSNTIATFNSPFSTFIYNAISSYSTVQGPLVTFPQMYSTFSTFSTVQGPLVTFPQMYSTFSTFSTVQGPLVTFPQLYSTISTFSTVLGQVIRYDELHSSFSSFSSVLGPTITVPQTHSTISSFSTSIGQVIRYDELQSSFSSFSSILGPIVRVPQMNTAISSFSIALGPVIRMNQIMSTMSSISTARIVDINNALSNYSTLQGPLVTTITFSNVLSTNSRVTRLTTALLNTSSFQIMGSNQPYIQYGSNVISEDGNVIVALHRLYMNNNYSIQLTYRNRDETPTLNVAPLSFAIQTTSNFFVYGDASTMFSWTTFGNLI